MAPIVVILECQYCKCFCVAHGLQKATPPAEPAAVNVDNTKEASPSKATTMQVHIDDLDDLEARVDELEHFERCVGRKFGPKWQKGGNDDAWWNGSEDKKYGDEHRDKEADDERADRGISLVEAAAFKSTEQCAQKRHSFWTWEV